MFSKPSRSCTFLCKIKYVAFLLLYSLTCPLGHSVPRWPPVCAGTVSSPGLRVPHSSFLTHLFQTLSSATCRTATRLSWALNSQLLSGAEKVTGAPAVFCMIPSIQSFGSLQMKSWPQQWPWFPLTSIYYVHYAVSRVSYYLLLCAYHTFLNFLTTLTRH